MTQRKFPLSSKTVLSFIVFLLSFSAFTQNKILIVGSNVGTVNKKVNGTFLMEIAIPFDYFAARGYEIHVMSPKGGKIAIYHKGDTVAVLKKILASEYFIQATSNSTSPEKINPKDYSAIIFPGGYGHFWDVYSDKKIADITAKIYEGGGVIGALGHGTADLLNVRLKSGDYLVKGKTLTCFPSWVEKEEMTEANYGKLLPVDMQQELAAHGAALKVCSKENIRVCGDTRIVDAPNRIVTASFADSGEFIAEEVVKMLGKR
ncbi:MAG: type 1 glutamine amidotransferase domain-containing protein [Bacteroidota bacterium]